MKSVPLPVEAAESPSKVTLQTIADRLGVSRMTVSMALRNHPGVADATRKRILGVARQLRYRPNAFASYLSRQRHSAGEGIHHANLALLVGHRDKDHRPLLRGYANVIAAAKEQARDLGYAMEDFWAYDPEQTGRTLDRMLEWRSVRGLVLLSFGPSDFETLPLSYDHYALVHSSASHERARCHHPSVDYYTGVRDMLLRLRRRGYSRIAMSLLRGNNQNHEDRLSAAFLQDQANHLPARRGLLQIDNSKSHDPRRRQRFLAWFRKAKPDAVVVWSTIGADYAAWLRDAGLWGQAAFFDLNVDFHPPGTVSGLAEPHAAMARAGVNKLISMIHHNETGFPESPEQITFTPNWVEAVLDH